MERVAIEVDPAPFGIKCAQGSVEIVKVIPGSQADLKGVQVGWRLVEAAGKKMNNSSEIARALSAGKTGGKKYSVIFEKISSIRMKEGDGHRVLSIARENTSSTTKPVEIPSLYSQPDDGGAGSVSCPKIEADETRFKSEGVKVQMAATEGLVMKVPDEGGSFEGEEEQHGLNNDDGVANESKKQGDCDQQAQSIEKQAEMSPLMNGKVILKYEMYAEEFEIENGSTTSKNIDDLYAFSDVMPGCTIHISELPPAQVNTKEGPDRYACYIPEDPDGTYQGLQANSTYYVYIHQDSEQEEKDRLEAKRLAASIKEQCASNEGCNDINAADFTDFLDSNAEAKQACTLNWANRFEIARQYGWSVAVTTPPTI